MMAVGLPVCWLCVWSSAIVNLPSLASSRSSSAAAAAAAGGSAYGLVRVSVTNNAIDGVNADALAVIGGARDYLSSSLWASATQSTILAAS